MQIFVFCWRIPALLIEKPFWGRRISSDSPLICWWTYKNVSLNNSGSVDKSMTPWRRNFWRVFHTLWKSISHLEVYNDFNPWLDKEALHHKFSLSHGKWRSFYTSMAQSRSSSQSFTFLRVIIPLWFAKEEFIYIICRVSFYSEIIHPLMINLVEESYV